MLRRLHGCGAVVAYWLIVEHIYKTEEPLNLIGSDKKTQLVRGWFLGFLDCSDSDLISWVETMLELDLLTQVNDSGEVSSGRIERELDKYHLKAETARQNGKKGGRPKTQKPTEKPSGFQSANQIGTKQKADRKLKEKNRRDISKEEIYKEESFELCENDEEATKRAKFISDVQSFFNAETGKTIEFLSGKDCLNLTRIYDHGRTLDDVKSVIRRKNSQWENDSRMAQYIRPSTLFGEKFEEYLNEAEVSNAESEYAGAF